jgi:hypothetical protein
MTATQQTYILGPILAALVLATLLMTGCNSIPVSWLATPAAGEVVDMPPVLAPVVEPQPDVAEWSPAYYAPKWMAHGYAGENAYREQSNLAAKGQYLKYDYKQPGTPDLAIHLLHWAHPTRSQPGKPWFKPDNWTDRALRGGVKGFVVVLPAGYNAEKVRDYYKDAKAFTQFIQDGKVVEQ